LYQKNKKGRAPVEEAGALHRAAEALRVADTMRRQLQQRPQQQQLRVSICTFVPVKASKTVFRCGGSCNSDRNSCVSICAGVPGNASVN
jgi:hypothetical protein